MKLKLSPYAEVMSNTRNCLIGLGVDPKEAQELLNKHYMLIKPHMYVEPIQELVIRILVEEHPELTISVVEKHLKSNDGMEKVDAFFDFIFKSHKRIEQNVNNFVRTSHKPLKNRSCELETDFFRDSPKLWECDPFTGTDMYGRSYIG